MASKITYAGRTTSVPGVYVTTDASGLASTSLTATGVVALIGTAEGGTPYTALSGRSDIRSYTSATALSKAYPAGDLLEAANIAFAATNDPAIAGGAQAVVPLKVNPSAQAPVTLAGSGGPSVTVTALPYGLAGNLTTVSVAPGSATGVKLTVASGAIIETGDNLGAEPVGTVSFAPAQGRGWQAMTGQVTDGALSVTGSVTLAGRKGELAASTVATPGSLAIQADPADAGKSLTLVGLDASGAAQTEVVRLASGPQSSAKSYSALLGVVLSAAAQDVTITTQSGTLLAVLDDNALTAGVAQPQDLVVAGAPVQVTGSAAGEKLVVVGLDAAGNPTASLVTLTTSPQPTPALSAVSFVALGGVAGPTSVTLSAPVVSVPASDATTAAMAAGALRAVPGMVVQIDAGDASTTVTQLDDTPQVDIVAGPLRLVSEVRALVDWAATSQLVRITAPAGSVGLPVPTSSPVYLAGGAERPATAADYQACLSLLRQVRVNTVVPLTSDPAVLAAVDAHCALMCGAGQSERDCVLGVANTAGSDVPSFAEFTAAAGRINSRHSRVVGQAISLYDSKNSLTEFPAPFLAAAVAGMQASAGVGVPLTHKTVSAVAVRQSASWSPMDDADALLDAGCCFFEQKDNIGIRMVRNVTTYTAEQNLALQEASVNQVVDFTAYNVRLGLERFVGQRGFSGTVNDVTAAANQLLQDLIARTIIVSYQPPEVVIVGDVMNVAITFSPVLPLNFVLCQLALTLPPSISNQTAA